MKKQIKSTIFALIIAISGLLMQNNTNCMQKLRKKAKFNKNFIIDPYFWEQQLLPFIASQKDILKFRLASKHHKRLVSEYSEKKPIKFKEINQSNFKEFIIWLKKNKNIDYFVSIYFDNFYHLNNKKLKTKEIKKVFDILKNQIKALKLFLFDMNKISYDILQKSNINKLEINDCDNITKKHFEKLPENLEILIIKGHQTAIKDNFLISLPKKIKTLNLKGATRITGECFINFPSKVQKLSLSVHVKGQYLKDLPKNLQSLSIKSCFIENKWLKNWPLNLKILKVNSNFLDKDIKYLPKKLEILDISDSTFNYRKEFIGKFLKDLPTTLKYLKVFSLTKIQKKYLQELPKHIKTIYIKTGNPEIINDKTHKEKIKIIRNKDIKIKTSNEEKYPVFKYEPIVLSCELALGTIHPWDDFG